jgi:hypothetical protein
LGFTGTPGNGLSADAPFPSITNFLNVTATTDKAKDPDIVVNLLPGTHEFLDTNGTALVGGVVAATPGVNNSITFTSANPSDPATVNCRVTGSSTAYPNLMGPLPQRLIPFAFTSFGAVTFSSLSVTNCYAVFRLFNVSLLEINSANFSGTADF